MQTNSANLPANDDVGAALDALARMEGVDLARLAARAHIDEHAAYARRVAKRYGVGAPQTVQAACFVIRMIRSYRAKFCTNGER
jgi:hypothetical protein